MKHLINQGLPILIALLLAGCAGTLFGTADNSRVTSVQTRVDLAFAATLGSDATTGVYTAVDGSSMTLTLGPSYVSASGQTCRIGRRDGDRNAYGFCRNGADWYAVPPAFVSGN